MSGKNNVVQDLLSYVIQKFKGYEISINQLKRQQKCFLESIDIVYEPVKANDAIACFFTSSLHLAYISYFPRKIKNNQFISNLTTRKCCYCDRFFVKKNVFEKHIKVCSNIAGIAYKFDNRKIVSFQDNFWYKGELSFTVYFNFETTTGDSVIDDKKCSLVAIGKDALFIMIFGRFQKNFEEISSLDYSAQDHVRFFDPVKIKQLRDTDLSVLTKG